MRRITLFVSALLFCFLTCGTLAADAATPKPPPPKHHHAGKKKPKPAKPNVPHPHNDQGKAKAKDNSQQHSKAQAAKERAVTSTTHGGKTAGTSVVGRTTSRRPYPTPNCDRRGNFSLLPQR